MRHLHFIIEVPAQASPVRYGRGRIYPERKWPEQYEADHLYEQYTNEDENEENDNEGLL